MDDPSDPRRYALPRPPFRRWEAEPRRDMDDLAVLLRRALALGLGQGNTADLC